MSAVQVSPSPKPGLISGFLKHPSFHKRVFWFLGAVFVALFLYFYSAFIFEIISSRFFSNQPLDSLAPLALNVIFLVIGTWIFLEVSKFFISKHLENRGKKKEIKLILTLYSYVVWGLMIVLIASTIFKDIGIFVASLGLIGFGLTFALQKPILNFVGWLTVVVNKPFNVGDRIEVAGHRGDVVAIHSLYTAIQGTRTESHEKSEKIITLPNEFILTNPVVNYTKRVDLFWEDMTVVVTYESNWKKAEGMLLDVANEVVKKYVTLPAVSVNKDKKSFEDAMRLLEEASKKLSKGILKQSLKENLESMKTIEQQSREELPVPSIRLDLLDAGIGLNVLFLADIRRIRTMRSEIARNFLVQAEKHKDIKIAYPHRHIIFSDKRDISQNGSKKVTDFS